MILPGLRNLVMRCVGYRHPGLRGELHVRRLTIVLQPMQTMSGFWKSIARGGECIWSIPPDSTGLTFVTTVSQMFSVHLYYFNSTTLEIPIWEWIALLKIVEHKLTALSEEHFMAQRATPRIASFTISGSELFE